MESYNYKVKGLRNLSLIHLFKGIEMALDKEIGVELRCIMKCNSGALGK